MPPHPSSLGYSDSLEGLIFAVRNRLGGVNQSQPFGDSWDVLIQSIADSDLPGSPNEYYPDSPSGVIECLRDKAGSIPANGYYPGSLEGLRRILIDILNPNYQNSPYTATFIGLIAILVDSSLYEAPANFSFTTGGTTGNQSIQFNWQNPSTPPTSHTLEISTDGINWTNAVVVNYPTNTYTYTGLNQPFYYGRIRANYPQGNSRWITSDIIVFISMLPLIPIPALFA